MKYNTMLYWHKLEHFYPYILEAQNDEKIKTFNVCKETDFPDFSDPQIPEKMQVRYYEVYLGLFKVDSALKVLAEKMGAENEFQDESDDLSCFCKFRLMENGRFDSKSFRLSSFPWAVQRVKKGEIDLEEWDESFQSFQRMFFLQFFDGEEPVTYAMLESILGHISQEIGWKIEFDVCWMRIDRVIGEKKECKEAEERLVQSTEEEPEELDEDEIVDELIKSNDLLNSFYVRDLERVNYQIRNKNYGRALDEYTEHEASSRIDVENDMDALYKIFSPSYLPRGKWPGGFPLRAMQQLAVNLAVNQELAIGNIFSVNGPPGTGKTTLLRDIIASVIVSRADKLCNLSEPDEAFGKIIGEVVYNGFVNRVKELREELRFGGILVASNNNSAVKNITEELPEKTSVAKQYREKYAYFSQVSDRLLKKETWGLCAAALGNKGNRRKFIDEFWPLSAEEPNGKFDLNQYLRKMHTGKDQRTREECVQAWRMAKERYGKKRKEIEEIYAAYMECYREIGKKMELCDALRCLQDKYNKGEEQLNQVNGELSALKTYMTEIEKEIREKEELKLQIKRNTTFFTIKYLFRNKLLDYKELEDNITKLLMRKQEYMDREMRLCAEKKELCDQLEALKREINVKEQDSHNQTQILQKWKAEHCCTVPDREYLEALTGKKTDVERAKAQNVCPWDSPELLKKREELFLEAMALNRAFVENSKQMRVQLDAFGKLMRGLVEGRQAAKLTTPLLQSFQLMVPVISTTFASVGSFLRYAERETFGLLLVDEAGQALPQSAPGAVWRSVRCVVVGDPLQIEPVVTIHDKTIQYLKTYFRQSDFIASKDTSVQSLADCSSSYGGYRVYGEKKLWIGSPLLVHGRCQRSIFEISNAIAYNNKMIFGTKERSGAVCRWLDVRGNAASGHFVKNQAEAIVKLVVNEFREAAEAGRKIPSLFIITPFRSVKAGLIRYFRDYEKLFWNKAVSGTKEINFFGKWLYTAIGTIHTFQGKEADTVIICLGADSGGRSAGAVQWASEKPNILNVAVTRAKRKLYIVGDTRQWARRPYFCTAYEVCGKMNTVETESKEVQA